MKTLNTFIAASLIIVGSAGFASAHNGTADKNLNVPLAPGVWEESNIEVPESLKFIKARSASVPAAEFIWGDPSEVPASLVVVPSAPFIAGDSNESAPLHLAFVKAKSALVPTAPFVFGEPGDAPLELSVK